MKTVKGVVSGIVQGVGYRYFAKKHADHLKIQGYARNLANGKVEVILQGEDKAIDILIKFLEQGPEFASVSAVEIDEFSEIGHFHCFSIE